MSKTVNTQSKSQRIKATKKHLQNVEARVHELRAMMELFNTSTDLGEMYKSIKQTVIDPICYDIRTAETTTPTMFDSRGYRVATEVKMGNPGSNKFCKQNVVTVSRCTRMLLKIAEILMPTFHAIGMNVWFRDLKAIKKPSEQYRTLCTLFADAEAKINSMPKTRKTINRTDRLASRINGLIEHHDPDMQFILSGILHMKMTTGMSDQELVDFFLSDLQLPVPAQSGGGPESDYNYDPRYQRDPREHYGYDDRERYDDRYDDGYRRGYHKQSEADYQPRSPDYQPRSPDYQPGSPSPDRSAPSFVLAAPPAPAPAPVPSPIPATREARAQAYKSKQFKSTYDEEHARRIAMRAEISQLKTSLNKMWKQLGMVNPASKLSHVQKLQHAQRIAATQQEIFAKVGSYFETSKANMFIIIGTVGSAITLYMMGAMPAVMDAIAHAATISGSPPIPINITANVTEAITEDQSYGDDWWSYNDWKGWAIYGASSVRSGTVGGINSMWSAVTGPSTYTVIEPLLIAALGLLSVALIAQGMSARATRGQEGRGKIMTVEAIAIALDSFKHSEKGMGRCWDQTNRENINCPVDEKYYPYDDETQKKQCLSHDGCQWLDNSSALTVLMSYIDDLDDVARGYFDIEDLTAGQLTIIKENKKLRHTIDIFDIIVNQINQTMLTNDNLAQRLTQLNEQTATLVNLSTQYVTDAAFTEMIQNPITSAGFNAIIDMADKRMQNANAQSTARKQLFAGLASVGLAVATGGASIPQAIASATALGINHATTTADNEGISARNNMRTIANIATGAAGLHQLTMERPDPELRQAYKDLASASGDVAAAALMKAGTATKEAISAIRSAPQSTRQYAIALAENARHVGTGLVNAMNSRRAQAEAEGVPIRDTQEEIEAALEKAVQQELQEAHEKLQQMQQIKVRRDRVEDLTKQRDAVRAQTIALQQKEKARLQKKQRQERQSQEAAAALLAMNYPGGML